MFQYDRVKVKEITEVAISGFGALSVPPADLLAISANASIISASAMLAGMVPVAISVGGVGFLKANPVSSTTVTATTPTQPPAPGSSKARKRQGLTFPSPTNSRLRLNLSHWVMLSIDFLYQILKKLS